MEDDKWLAPGSDAARAQGCQCPIMDNNRGKYPPYPPAPDMPEGGWYMVVGCPVHDRTPAA